MFLCCMQFCRYYTEKSTTENTLYRESKYCKQRKSYRIYRFENKKGKQTIIKQQIIFK